MTDPKKSHVSKLMIIGLIVMGIASFFGLGAMITHAVQKVISGHGLDTFHTVWLVEFNYIGLLVMFGVVLVVFLIGGGFKLYEHFQLRALEKNMVCAMTMSNFTFERDAAEARRPSTPRWATVKTMSLSQIAFAVALFIAPAVSAADGGMPPPTWGDGSVSATTSHDPVVPLRMGSMEVTLEKTSLKEVQSTIGAGTIYSHGDASEALAWLCYTVSTSNPKQRLWLSSGEMGGLKIIDGVAAEVIPTNVNPSADCPELPQRYLPLRFANGIWLGAPEERFQKSFGKVKKVKDARAYIYIGKDGEYDVIGSLNIRFKNSASVAIFANHVTSN
jgi:hypothetical protein